VPDAWIDTARRDPRDNQVGLVGYEINFNRYFYRYTPPRPLEEIEGDIRAIEADIVRMLAEVTGEELGDDGVSGTLKIQAQERHVPVIRP
jgi:hypothetical protein